MPEPEIEPSCAQEVSFGGTVFGGKVVRINQQPNLKHAKWFKSTSTPNVECEKSSRLTNKPNVEYAKSLRVKTQGYAVRWGSQFHDWWF